MGTWDDHRGSTWIREGGPHETDTSQRLSASKDNSRGQDAAPMTSVLHEPHGTQPNAGQPRTGRD